MSKTVAMKQMEPLPENPTIEDVIKQMRMDHDCRDQQHLETTKTLKWNNIKTMIASGGLAVTLIGGGYTTIKLITNTTGYFYTINEKLDGLKTDVNAHSKKIDAIQNQQNVNTGKIEHLEELSGDNHRILSGVDKLLARKIK